MAKCSECGGNNAKKLSVIEKMGTDETRMGRVILGAGTVRSKSKQAIEASYKFGEEKGGFLQGLGCFVALTFWVIILGGLGELFQGFADFIFTTGGFIFILLLLFALYGGWMALPFMRNIESKNQAKRKEWEKTWMCLDCGHKWVGKK